MAQNDVVEHVLLSTSSSAMSLSPRRTVTPSPSTQDRPSARSPPPPVITDYFSGGGDGVCSGSWQPPVSVVVAVAAVLTSSYGFADIIINIVFF